MAWFAKPMFRWKTKLTRKQASAAIGTENWSKWIAATLKFDEFGGRTAAGPCQLVEFVALPNIRGFDDGRVLARTPEQRTALYTPLTWSGQTG